MLERFFAVTANDHARSLYRVDHDNGKERHFPKAEKIALRGRSDYDVGEALVAPLIVVADALYFCYSEKLCPGDNPNPSIDGRRVVSHTSSIVGLFLFEEEAQECFGDYARSARNPFWLVRTCAVIESIGEDHPVFKISHTPGLELLSRMVA